jgi:signal transduction histidine kinase
MMVNFLRGSLITQVTRQHLENRMNIDFNATNVFVATTAGNVALSQLRTVLLYLNSGLLFVIPAATWALTGKTLTPLKKAHERERLFVSDASHELKTPLSIMLGEADVALTKTRPISEYKTVINSFKEEVGRLYTLVDNLLLLARSDQHGLADTFQTVDVVDLVFQVSNNLKTKIKDKKITLQFDPPDQTVAIRGNTTLIKQLIFNLIDNAVNYNKEKGTISVLLSKTRNNTLIKVKDDGLGISVTDQENIFNRFFRADTSRSQTKGYGLGLAICKSIVNLHHGTIFVTSVPNKGSTFTVSIPNR